MNQYPPAAQGRLDTARALATASDVSLGVAGAGLAAAIWGLTMKADRPASSASLHPWVGFGQAGFGVTF
jgi:hypothetical protein